VIATVAGGFWAFISLCLIARLSVVHRRDN
jgi:hypothetical protein